ncbi:MAG: YihY family inner membrane protein [Xanthomonadales bacterium]|nr:YihY family inner membrane protein [Xanthomonadales bacterium]
MFVPEAARTVEGYIQEFAAGAARLTVAGVLASIVSALIMMASVEDALNRIFRVRKARRTAVRLTMYWTVLTLGPLLVAAAFALSSEVVGATLGEGAAPWMVAWLPPLVLFLAFTMAYVVVPNTQVPLRHAALGAALATALFLGAKAAFTAYLAHWPTYQQIYGAVAVVPIFLLWIYLAWLVVLLGASLTASLAAFRWLPDGRRLPEGMEFYALLRIALALAEARGHGRGLSLRELLSREPYLEEARLLGLLEGLLRAGIVQRIETGEWVMVRDPERLGLEELHRSGLFPLPRGLTVLPGEDEPSGRAARAVIAGLAAGAGEALRGNLAELAAAAASAESSTKRP